MKLAQYTINGYEDIRRLSLQLLGEQSRWRELVELNGLDYPFISDSPKRYAPSRVLGPNDILRYPAPVNTSSPFSVDTAGGGGFGYDLAFKDGYIVPDGGSFATVTGTENLRGALERRLNTPRGNLPAHPTTYGHFLKPYLGLLGGQAQIDMIIADCERCVREDDRVSAVVGRAALDGDAVLVDQEVTPTDDRKGRVYPQVRIIV